MGPYNTVTEAFGHGAELQYYAVFHHKRLINGNISRAPAGTTHDYRQWKLITALAEERSIPDLNTARTEFQQLSRDWDIRYVIIHRDMIAPDLANWAAGFFNTRSDWCLVDEEGPLLAYHRLDGNACPTASLLDPPPDGAIKIGDGSDDRYLGPGWYLAENIGGPQARWTGSQTTAEVRVHLTNRPYRVTMQATSYLPNQVVTVTANGNLVGRITVADNGWADYELNLSASMIPTDGWITLAFTANQAQSAYDRSGGQVDDKRALSVAYDSIAFDPVQ